MKGKQAMKKKTFHLHKATVQSDRFTSMPATAQALFLQIAGTCDENGCTNHITVSKLYSHATDEDVGTLIANGYLETVENGPLDMPGYRLNTGKAD